MKELWTKKFWRDVKKTFEEAQQDAAPEQDRPLVPPEDKPSDAPAKDTPTAS
jgi:hypothetical protein